MDQPVATKIGAHITSALFGGAFATAQFRQYNAWEGDLSGISPDELIVATALPTVVFLVIFVAGHMMIRKLNEKVRLAYSLLGFVALFAASLSAMPIHLIQTAMDNGIVSILVALNAAIGSLIGFLHLRSAGYEFDENEIAQIEEALASKASSSAASLVSAEAQASGQASGERGQSAPAQAVQTPAKNEADDNTGVVRTKNGTFFDGPLQVITSGNAVFAAALSGGLVHFLYTAIIYLGFSNGKFGASESLKDDILSGGVFSSVVFGLMFSIVVCMITLPPAIYILHKFLVSRNRVDLTSYVVAGGALPLGTGLLMFGLGLLLTHWLILPLAAAMGVYHRLAGIEPAALPDDIEVSDPRALIAEDHVRRRMRRVVG
ncbi:MAG: hypothetical protein ABJ205_07275 [Erythrobacter sp.]|uniref:hypothetical protein n=1 Tax=Erythrobacter sp. TaxID=1042 RepID=UPI0032656D22